MSTECMDATTARALARDLAPLAAAEGARRLQALADGQVADVLQEANPALAAAILVALPADRCRNVLEAAPAAAVQWRLNLGYPDATVGRLMESALAVFDPALTVAATVERVRELTKTTFVTYCFVAAADRLLIGVVAMRDLLLAEREATLEALMIRHPFTLPARLPLLEAARAVVARHYPEYPVVDERGLLLGLVRGRSLFEQQALEISAQAGAMVGVQKEERLSTPWTKSLKFRHPWLQLNLLTAFGAAAVVGTFQGTLNRLVILAMFMPVLSGQSGNTGGQALAVTLRGLTLGELGDRGARALITKEGLLGLMNGALCGSSAGIGMYLIARAQGSTEAVRLALVVLLAMIGSCMISGVVGALVPLMLRRFNADPANASSIFLSAATDVASMAMFLGLASLLAA